MPKPCTCDWCTVLSQQADSIRTSHERKAALWNEALAAMRSAIVTLETQPNETDLRRLVYRFNTLLARADREAA